MGAPVAAAMRTVHCAEALAWLAACPAPLDAIITSPPDAAEVGMELGPWGIWFRQAVLACLQTVSDTGPCIFYVTDRKAGGGVYSKAAAIFEVAGRFGYRLLWHKVVLRRPVGSTDLHRPGYSHLLAYSRAGKPGPATSDVVEGGLRVYANGMAYNAARLAVAHAARTAGHITDPFCGRGTVLAYANLAGLPATGVDNDPEQCRASLALVLGGTYTGVGDA